MEKVKQLSNVVVAERLGYWNRNRIMRLSPFLAFQAKCSFQAFEAKFLSGFRN